MTTQLSFHRFSRARRVRAGVLAAAIAPVAMFAGTSHAWLGGFEAADGYQPFLNMVQHYNAGQYGPGSGYIAMSPVAIAANSALWTAVDGGFSTGGNVSYATGHQWYDRTYVNSGGTLGLVSDQGLVLTTGHEGAGGPALKYRYNLDSSDLGGVAPSTTGNQTVKLTFWNRGQLPGPELSGLATDGYFGNEVAFRDSGGNVGFRLGLTQRATGDTVTYWNGTSLFESTLIGSASVFDRWDITLDMATDTFSATYLQFSTSTSYPLVVGAPMQSAMSDFSGLEFRSSQGTNNSKLWAVDDFSFDVRIPAAPTVLGLIPGAIVAMGRRRRR